MAAHELSSTLVLEMFRATVIFERVKFRGLLMNCDFPCGYLDMNISTVSDIPYARSAHSVTKHSVLRVGVT